MLHVLRHYLPIRKAALVFSETVLMTTVLAAVMSGHLWRMQEAVVRSLARESLSIEDARFRCLSAALLVSVLAQIAISFNELYDIRVSSSRYDRSRRFVGSAGSAMVLSIVCVVLAELWGLERVLDFPGLPLTQKIFLLTFALLVCFTLLYPWRTLFHFLLRRWNFNSRVLIVGSGSLARSILKEIQDRPDSGYEVAGLLTDMPLDPEDEDGREEAIETAGIYAHHRGAESLPDGRNHWKGGEHGSAESHAAPSALLLERPTSEGSLEVASSPELLAEGLLELVDRLEVDTIAMVHNERRGSLSLKELLRVRLSGIMVLEGERLYEKVTGKLAVEGMRPSYLIFGEGFVQHPLGELAKRIMNVSVALIGLLLTWPAMLLTALAIRLDSPGPILFRQERMGQEGKLFTLYKFRSMRADAEKATGPVWAQEDDPRITKVGRFMRKTRLDELPQLFNVLVGDMSFVGPRPEREHFVKELAEQIPYFEQRHMVKPGLTGWAQINYPYGNTVEDALKKLQYDLFYIKNRSILFDLSIAINTIKTVVLRKGT